MTYRELGKLISDLREARGLTQEQVAEKVGLKAGREGRTQVIRWEKGENRPKQFESKLCEVLGVDVGLFQAVAVAEKYLDAARRVLDEKPAVEALLQDALASARPAQHRRAQRRG